MEALAWPDVWGTVAAIATSVILFGSAIAAIPKAESVTTSSYLLSLDQHLEGVGPLLNLWPFHCPSEWITRQGIVDFFRGWFGLLQLGGRWLPWRYLLKDVTVKVFNEVEHSGYEPWAAPARLAAHAHLGAHNDSEPKRLLVVAV